MKSAFLVSKGLLCLYEKKNNTGFLVDMELRVQLDISVKHSKSKSKSKTLEEKFRIYARP